MTGLSKSKFKISIINIREHSFFLYPCKTLGFMLIVDIIILQINDIHNLYVVNLIVQLYAYFIPNPPSLYNIKCFVDKSCKT